MKKHTGQQIWVRMGDNSDYENFSDLAEAAEFINDFHVIGIKDYVRAHYSGGLDILMEPDDSVSGFTAEGFENYNYISIFWGDDDAQMEERLSVEEWRLLERIIVQMAEDEDELRQNEG